MRCRKLVNYADIGDGAGALLPEETYELPLDMTDCDLLLEEPRDEFDITLWDFCFEVWEYKIKPPCNASFKAFNLALGLPAVIVGLLCPSKLCSHYKPVHAEADIMYEALTGLSPLEAKKYGSYRSHTSTLYYHDKYRTGLGSRPTERDMKMLKMGFVIGLRLAQGKLTGLIQPK